MVIVLDPFILKVRCIFIQPDLPGQRLPVILEEDIICFAPFNESDRTLFIAICSSIFLAAVRPVEPLPRMRGRFPKGALE